MTLKIGSPSLGVSVITTVHQKKRSLKLQPPCLDVFHIFFLDSSSLSHTATISSAKISLSFILDHQEIILSAVHHPPLKFRILRTTSSSPVSSYACSPVPSSRSHVRPTVHCPRHHQTLEFRHRPDTNINRYRFRRQKKEASSSLDAYLTSQQDGTRAQRAATSGISRASLRLGQRASNRDGTHGEHRRCASSHISHAIVRVGRCASSRDVTHGKRRHGRHCT